MRILLDAHDNPSCDAIFSICSQYIREQEGKTEITPLTKRNATSGDGGAFVEHFDYKDLKVDGVYYTASSICHRGYMGGELVFFDRTKDNFIEIYDKNRHMGKIVLWRVGRYENGFWTPENFHFLNKYSGGVRLANVVGIKTNL